MKRTGIYWEQRGVGLLVGPSGADKMGNMNKKMASLILIFVLVAGGFAIILPLSVPTARALKLHSADPAESRASWEDTHDPVGAPAPPDGTDFNGDTAHDGIVRWHSSEGGHAIQADFIVESGYKLTIDAHNFNPITYWGDAIIMSDGTRITVQSGGELETKTDFNTITTHTAFVNGGSGWDGIYIQGGAKANMYDFMVTNSLDGVRFESGSEITSPGIRYGKLESNTDYDLYVDGAYGVTDVAYIDTESVGTAAFIANCQVNISDSVFDGHGVGQNSLTFFNTNDVRITNTVIDGVPTNAGDLIYLNGTSGTLIKGTTMVNGSLGSNLVHCANGASPLVENCTLYGGMGIFSVFADGGGGGGGSFPVILNGLAPGGGPFDNTSLQVTGDSSVTVQWWRHVYCDDGAGSPMSGATVNIYNNSLALVASGSTGGDGYLYWNRLTEFVGTSTFRYNYNPFNVTAASAPYANFTIETVDSSGDTTVVLDVIGGDTTKPSISAPSITSRYADSVTIQWSADESSNAVVWYGLDGVPATEASGSMGTLLQEVTITGLLPGRSYTYAINSTDAVGNKNSSAEPPVSTLYTFSTKYNISLNQGWNMISLILNQSSTFIDSVLGSIAGEYRAVQWWNPMDVNDHWKHWADGKPMGNDLTDITRHMGFWIYITAPAGTTLQVDGAAPHGAYTNQMPLQKGWNYVGYPSVAQRTSSTALSGLAQFEVAWHYDSNLGSWTGWGTGTPNDLTDLKPGEGYWIHMNGLEIWDVLYA